MRLRRLLTIALLLFLSTPGVALAHEAPENDQSKWVMADWMIDVFFIFSGIAFVAFLAAWKAGHFHELEKQAGIALLVEEEDYYTPDWALDEEEWADGHHAER
jgi:heme/copper-type cytochrome/quinol oxidase subunit 2